MITLTYRFRQCGICGYLFRTKRKRSRENRRLRVSLGCQVCNYEDIKRRFLIQLKLDLKHLVFKGDTWIKSQNEEDFDRRIRRTIRWLYSNLDPISADEVFYSAVNQVWYEEAFTQAQNYQSSVSHQRR